MEDITELVRSDAEIESMVACVEYREGFKVRVRHLTPSALMSITESCREHVWDDKARARVERLNDEQFVRLLGRKLVVDWSGLTLRKLSKMMFLKLDKIPEDKLDLEIASSDANVAAVIKGVPGFDAFLQSCSRDVTLFSVADREDAVVKNS